MSPICSASFSHPCLSSFPFFLLLLYFFFLPCFPFFFLFSTCPPKLFLVIPSLAMGPSDHQYLSLPSLLLSFSSYLLFFPSLLYKPAAGFFGTYIWSIIAKIPTLNGLFSQKPTAIWWQSLSGQDSELQRAGVMTQCFVLFCSEFGHTIQATGQLTNNSNQ